MEFSPNGTSYDPNYIQQVHQAYGQAYQLPNITAHNETCANVGNVLWNYRMLLATGDSRYADILETTLYNSVLSGTDLTGTRFNYTNPLRVDHTFTLQITLGRGAGVIHCLVQIVVRPMWIGP